MSPRSLTNPEWFTIYDPLSISPGHQHAVAAISESQSTHTAAARAKLCRLACGPGSVRPGDPGPHESRRERAGSPTQSRLRDLRLASGEDIAVPSGTGNRPLSEEEDPAGRVLAVPQPRRKFVKSHHTVLYLVQSRPSQERRHAQQTIKVEERPRRISS